MKAPFSAYLTEIKGGLRQLIGLLRREYDYVSVLATCRPHLPARPLCHQ